MQEEGLGNGHVMKLKKVITCACFWATCF